MAEGQIKDDVLAELEIIRHGHIFENFDTSRKEALSSFLELTCAILSLTLTKIYEIDSPTLISLDDYPFVLYCLGLSSNEAENIEINKKGIACLEKFSIVSKCKNSYSIERKIDDAISSLKQRRITLAEKFKFGNWASKEVKNYHSEGPEISFQTFSNDDFEGLLIFKLISSRYIPDMETMAYR